METQAKVECQFCHTTTHQLMLTKEGWQCSDGIDCYGRQPAKES